MAAPRFIYSFAASLDGFIADAKGGVKWLDVFNDVDYGLEGFFRSIDAIVMGRKTYEVGLKLGMPSMGKRTIILTRKKKKGHGEVEFWNKPLKALARDLEKQGATRVWVMGGAQTASAFADAGLLDEVEVVTFPVILGTGILMFGKTRKPLRMELAESKTYPNGAMLRRYRKPAGKAASA